MSGGMTQRRGRGGRRLRSPNRAAEGTGGAELGDCFMMIGREEGKLRPCSRSLMSFMAMENSSRSILPSLSVSARRLHGEEEGGGEGVGGGGGRGGD